ncbi:MAG: PorT family protein [Flavobacteriaceae bacterium]|nr:PorT family protein [Flavobacteriaceae bacterium]
MKKLMFLTVTMFLCVAVAQAQGPRFGAKAGVNIAGVNGDDTDGTDSRTGLNIGGVASFDLGEIFSIQPEVTYSMRGFGDGEFTIKIDYVDVPVMGDVEIAEGLSLQGGPVLGFNISGTVEDGAGNESDLEDVSTLNVGAGIGVQYEFEFGLFITARYDTAFNDVIDNNFDAKNNNIGLSVGWWFDSGSDE